MTRLARVAPFTIGCENIPVDLGSSIAVLLSFYRKKGKLKHLCKCLYPFYLISLEKDAERYIAFVDACNPDSTNEMIVSQENLMKINKCIVSLSETSEIINSLLILKEIADNAEARERFSTIHPVEPEISRILVKSLSTSSMSDITLTISLHPYVAEKQIVDIVQKFVSLSSEIAASTRILSLFGKVRNAVLEIMQKNIDEAFKRLDMWKIGRKREYSRNLREHQSNAYKHENSLHEVEAIINENERLLNEINSDLTTAGDSMTSANASNRYRLNLRVSELRRQQEKAKSNRRGVESSKKLIQSALRNEQRTINKLEKTISEVDDYLPDSLKKSAKELEDLKIAFESTLDRLNEAHLELKKLRGGLVKADKSLNFEETNTFEMGEAKGSICLLYVPVYLIFFRRFGFQQEWIAVGPCSLPNTLSLLQENKLSKYIEERIGRMKKSDFKAIEAAAKVHNIIRRHTGITELQMRLQYIKDEELISGVDEKLWKKALQTVS